MTPIILVTGPDDELETYGSVGGATISTADIYEGPRSRVHVSVNGRVLEVPAFEPVDVAPQVLEVLKAANIEVEVVEEEGEE